MSCYSYLTFTTITFVSERVHPNNVAITLSNLPSWHSQFSLSAVSHLCEYLPASMHSKHLWRVAGEVTAHTDVCYSRGKKCKLHVCQLSVYHSVINKLFTLNNRVWIILAFNRQHRSYLTPTVVSVIAIFILKITFIIQTLIFFPLQHTRLPSATKSSCCNEKKVQFKSPNTNINTTQ